MDEKTQAQKAIYYDMAVRGLKEVIASQMIANKDIAAQIAAEADHELLGQYQDGRAQTLLAGTLRVSALRSALYLLSD